MPQSPADVHISNQKENSVTLKWNKPKHDGGSLITGYRVEIRKPDSDTWEIANDYPIRGNEFTTDNLQTGKPYEFRVKARNAAGWGDYSELDCSITLKPNSGNLFLFFIMKIHQTIGCFSSSIITRHARSEKSWQKSY